MTRDEELAAWKLKRAASKPKLQPFANGGVRAAIPGGRSPKRALRRESVDRRREGGIAEKENLPVPVLHEISRAPVTSARPPRQIPNTISSTQSSAARPGRRTSLQPLEAELVALRGQMSALKRDSRRASITGELPHSVLPPVSEESEIGMEDNLLDSLAGGNENAPGAANCSTGLSAGSASGNANGSSIAARLEALRRETSRMSGAVNGTPLKAKSAAPSHPSQNGVHFEAAGQMDCRGLAALAIHLFEEEKFKAALEKGQNATLQRTRDGATAESRIAELAALVKLLRRSLTQLSAKKDQFTSQSLKFEREAAQQVEAVKLAAESRTLAMEAELAAARRDAAQASSALKSATASWHSELDWQKAEVSRVKRDMERVESERERAREDAKRAEVAKAQLADNVKGLKKEAGQQLRELQVDRGEAVRALQEGVEAAEARRAALQQEVSVLQQRAQQADATTDAVQQLQRATQQELSEVQSSLALLQGEHQQLIAKHHEAIKATAALQEKHSEVVASSSKVLVEYQQLQEQAATLLARLDDAASTTQQLQQEVDLAHAAAAAGESAAAVKTGAHTTALNSAAEREARLLESQSQLKAALGVTLEQKGALELDMQDASQELVDLQQQLDASKAAEMMAGEELALAASAIQAARKEAAEGVAAASAAQDAAAAQFEELTEKSSRLAHLEGELEAFQDVIGAGDQSQMLSRLVSRVASLDTALAEGEMRRRALHNQLVELRGNIRVFCRVRPAPDSAVACSNDKTSLRLSVEDGKEHGFSFDHVFGPPANQADIFAQVSDMVQSALDGYKVCLFSYGQTGAGKTHTMQGTRSAAGAGIIPRSVRKILEAVERLREHGWVYSLEASYIEVYNEQLRDLLAAGNTKRDGARLLDAAAIKHDSAGGQTLVAGAERVPVEHASDADDLVARASASRVVHTTAMNAASSRSHSVFMLYISGQHEASGTRVQGALNLVDLAGSERLNRSEAVGQRQKEACSINKSLSSLGDVFGALAAKSTHVPYRNSKLTHLLQPCLGGDGKTLMFVNINPEPASVGETLCSLRFARQVNACETAAKGGAKRNVSQADGATSAGSQAAGAAKRKAPGTGLGGAVRNLKPRNH